MNDRELLEMAAKAAGFETMVAHDELHTVRRGTDNMAQKITPWNPLTSDGDAFRLAVKLGIHLTNSVTDAWATTLLVTVTEPIGADPCAATRLAITRAAAEIGRARA